MNGECPNWKEEVALDIFGRIPVCLREQGYAQGYCGRCRQNIFVETAPWMNEPSRMTREQMIDEAVRRVMDDFWMRDALQDPVGLITSKVGQRHVREIRAEFRRIAGDA